MVRGEPCTALYRVGPRKRPLEEVVSFHCMPRELAMFSQGASNAAQTRLDRPGDPRDHRGRVRRPAAGNHFTGRTTATDGRHGRPSARDEEHAARRRPAEDVRRAARENVRHRRDRDDGRRPRHGDHVRRVGLQRPHSRADHRSVSGRHGHPQRAQQGDDLARARYARLQDRRAQVRPHAARHDAENQEDGGDARRVHVSLRGRAGDRPAHQERHSRGDDRVSAGRAAPAGARDRRGRGRRLRHTRTPRDSFPAPIRRKPRRTTSSFPCSTAGSTTRPCA